jgi:hypothetical protein
MATQNPPLPSADDHRPYDQQDRAAEAQLNPRDSAAHASSPNYGTFGVADDTNTASQQPGRSGANDNPDEFSEFDDREKEAQKAPTRPEEQFGHIEQNQDPDAVRAAQHADTDEQRAAWSKDDPRYAGGGTHNTREEPADNTATGE